MNSLDDLKRVTRGGYRAFFCGSDLGPLSQAPKIRFRHSENSYAVYDAGGGEKTLTLEKERSVEISLYLKDAGRALTLASALTAKREGKLLLCPEPPDKGISLRFAGGSFLPEAEFSPESGKEHSVKLTYLARVETPSGNLFTLA